MKEFFLKFIKRTTVFIWILFILLSISAFTLKYVIPVTLGVMLLSQSFIFFPWLDNICKKYNFKLLFVNKLVIFIVSFFATSYSIKINQESFITTFVAAILNILIWTLMIIYVKCFKKKKI